MAGEDIYVVTVYRYEEEPWVVGVYDSFEKASKVKRDARQGNRYVGIGIYTLNCTEHCPQDW